MTHLILATLKAQKDGFLFFFFRFYFLREHTHTGGAAEGQRESQARLHAECAEPDQSLDPEIMT